MSASRHAGHADAARVELVSEREPFYVLDRTGEELDDLAFVVDDVKAAYESLF